MPDDLAAQIEKQLVHEKRCASLSELSNPLERRHFERAKRFRFSEDTRRVLIEALGSRATPEFVLNLQARVCDAQAARHEADPDKLEQIARLARKLSQLLSESDSGVFRHLGFGVAIGAASRGFDIVDYVRNPSWAREYDEHSISNLVKHLDQLSTTAENLIPRPKEGRPFESDRESLIRTLAWALVGIGVKLTQGPQGPFAKIVRAVCRDAGHFVPHDVKRLLRKAVHDVRATLREMTMPGFKDPDLVNYPWPSTRSPDGKVKGVD